MSLDFFGPDLSYFSCVSVVLTEKILNNLVKGINKRPFVCKILASGSDNGLCQKRLGSEADPGFLEMGFRCAKGWFVLLILSQNS